MAIDLDSVRARLTALGLFKHVSDMVNAAAAMETPTRTPAAFVAVASERPSPNRTSGVHDQKVDVTVAVLLCLAAERAAGNLPDTAEDTRVAVIMDLTGWTPTGGKTAFDYSGYRVIRMGDGFLWLECTFATSWVLRK